MLIIYIFGNNLCTIFRCMFCNVSDLSHASPTTITYAYALLHITNQASMCAYYGPASACADSSRSQRARRSSRSGGTRLAPAQCGQVRPADNIRYAVPGKRRLVQRTKRTNKVKSLTGVRPQRNCSEQTLP
jgi:hypothetical protein